MKQNMTRKRICCLLLCLVLILPLFAGQAPIRAEASDEHPTSANDRPIIVSLGDSYSSGEGIEPFYGQSASMSVKSKNPDWLAHRSENAWSGMLRLPGVSGQMKDHRNANWYFVAASGAVTDNIRQTGTKVVDKDTGRLEGQQNKEYDRDGVKGNKNLDGQLDVFYNTPGLDRNDVDYVTITIGGNDVDFVGVITQAHHTILSTALYDFIDEKLDHFYDQGGVYYNLRDAYRRIEEAAPNATIIVAGYPELLDYSGKGAFFNRFESQYINRAVRIFNNRIAALVTECQQDGMKIEFADVAPKFQGCQAYSDTEYINEVYYFPDIREQDLKWYGITSSYSMHPNYRGAVAYAEAVQNVIDRLEDDKMNVRPARDTSDVRNVVLVQDTSGSMDGYKMNQTKIAAVEFIDTVLREDAAIGVVSYDDYAAMRADFSKDGDYLKTVVNDLYTGGNTNTEDGLRTAAEMLRNTPAQKKIIVLMSDGEANEGLTDDDLTAYANELKDEGILIYTLGFFDSWGSSYSAQRSMEGIASPGCHYEVDDAANLRFFFTDVADQINGTKYVYIRIECPVDVEVRYGDEILSSTENTTRASFGSLTFEDGNSYSYSSDNRTKILRLREGVDYQILIKGNGEGTMNYTAGFMDADGQYSDLREIKEVPITPQTYIQGNARRDAATELQVDETGDGRFDRTFSVGGPAKKTDLTFLIWIGLGVLLLAGGLTAFLLLRKRKKTVPAVDAGKAPKVKQAKPQVKPAMPQVKPVKQRTPASGGFCGNCGAPLDGKSAFCGNCGKPV